jgi:hypothetical protein
VTISSSITNGGALAGHRYRVIVSTDIGGTGPDDFQSMVHFLIYANCFDIEGLVSLAAIGPGRKKDILDVTDCYEQDYPNLKTYSDKYPPPDALRALTKQGETKIVPYAGVQSATEGSEWIVTCARRDDPRPLYILGWGGIEDVAQALHDAPDILPKLRVYWVGGPNKKWGPHQYQHIAENHPDLWIIEANSTYRGWFVGGNQSGQWGNTEFVRQHIAGKGALGEFFSTKLGGTIKMGDTPSVGWLLRGTPKDPSQPSWGGCFVRAEERPYSRFDRLPAEDDRMEQFGILEIVLPLAKAHQRTRRRCLMSRTSRSMGTRLVTVRCVSASARKLPECSVSRSAAVCPRLVDRRAVSLLTHQTLTSHCNPHRVYQIGGRMILLRSWPKRRIWEFIR